MDLPTGGIGLSDNVKRPLVVAENMKICLHRQPLTHSPGMIWFNVDVVLETKMGKGAGSIIPLYEYERFSTNIYAYILLSILVKI